MATKISSENFLQSGEVSLKGFLSGLAESKDKYNRHKSMILYGSTFIISAYRTGEKLLVKQEFNIDELTKARRFYRSIRFFKNHSNWLQEFNKVDYGKTLDSLSAGSRQDNEKR